MGNLCSSCCENPVERAGYAEIVDSSTELTPGQGGKTGNTAATEAEAEKEGMEFSSVQKDEKHFGTEKFDQSLSPFKGLFVDLKFTSKSSYEPKFVWLNSYSNTIHMSQVASKERRHKEASLADVSAQAGCQNVRIGHHTLHTAHCIHLLTIRRYPSLLSFLFL